MLFVCFTPKFRKFNLEFSFVNFALLKNNTILSDKYLIVKYIDF